MKKIIIVLCCIICTGNIQAQILKSGGGTLKGTTAAPASPTVVNAGVKQLPARGGQPTTGNDKNDKYKSLPNKTETLSPSISGWYSTTSVVNGVKVTNKFKLHQNNNAVQKVNMSSKMIDDQSMGKINIVTKQQGNEKDAKGDNCYFDNRQVTLNDRGYISLDIGSQITKVLPGTAFHFGDYANGSWRAITENRNPFRISCSNANINGKVGEEVPDASQTSIRQAVANIYGRFPSDPAKVANLTFSMFAQEVTNQAELSVKIGGGGHGFGFSADNLFQYSTKSNKKTFFVDIVKTLYTIDTEENPNGLFADPSLNTNDVIYIGSVTYGIRILASIELDITDEEVMNSFNAKYNGFAYGGYINADVFAKDVKNQATVKFYVVGGTGSGITPAYNISEMQKRIEEMTKTINYHTCQPIRYSLRNNKKEIVSYASATDYFKYRSCDPPGENMKPATVKVRISGIQLKDMEKDDVDLYGMIWANAVKANYDNKTPKENIYHLMSLSAGLHLKNEDIKKGVYGFGYGRTVEFNFDAGEVAGAVLYIYFDLVDQDDSPDDPIVMPNLSKFKLKVEDGSIREFYGIKINLNDVLKSEQAGREIAVDCVDYEGSYPFTITLNIEKK